MVRLARITPVLMVATLLVFGGVGSMDALAAKKLAAVKNGLAYDSKSSQGAGRPAATKAPTPPSDTKSMTLQNKPDSDVMGPTDGASGPNYRNVDPNLRVSLPQAVSIAITRNLTMADSRLAVEEKEYQRREAYSDFFPSITLQYTGNWDRYRNGGWVSALTAVQDSRYAGFQQSVRRDDLFPGPPLYPFRIDPFRQFTGSVTITQPIFSGGKLISDYKYARLGVDYTAIQFDVNKQDLILNVYQAYYGMMQAEKLLEVANSSIRALEALRNQTMEFYKAGVVPKVDVLSTEGQLAQALIQRTQALADIAKNQANLNYFLRNPQDTPTDVVMDLSHRPSEYRLPDAYAIAAANRLEIRQANISVDQALALVKSAKADVMPSIDVATRGVRYNDDWNVIDPEGTNDWQIQGLLTWTFDMFRKRSTVAEKRTTEARAFVNRELLVETIMNEVKQAYEDMKRSESDIANNKAAVEYRTENFRINQERYKEQVATYVEVLDAQRQLSLSQGDYYISLMGFKINRATLERKMGILGEGNVHDVPWNHGAH